MKFARLLPGILLLSFSFSTCWGQGFEKTKFRDKDLMGSWSLYEPQGMHYAFLYSTGIRFGSNKSGPIELSGHWQEHVFFSANPTGKGDTETARILDNGDLEIHAAIFSSGETKDYVLHRVVPGQPPGGIAVVTPPPPDNGPKLAWPPPHGTISVGMTREDLEKLPWHRTGLHHITDGTRSEIYIYSYRCDDPTLVDLTVTVKNGRVVTINGGNG